ncbi:MAG: hypothetical protein U1F07_02460 [Rubrivivax sp.]
MAAAFRAEARRVAPRRRDAIGDPLLIRSRAIVDASVLAKHHIP